MRVNDEFSAHWKTYHFNKVVHTDGLPCQSQSFYLPHKNVLSWQRCSQCQQNRKRTRL